jgi:predicted CoA-binding protein
VNEANQEKAIIILGASSKRRKFSNKAVRAYRDIGWTVYPVHPNEKTVEGLTCFATIGEVPGRASTLSLYVPPQVGIKLIDAAPEKGVKDVYVNPGAGSPELVARIRELGMNPIEACSILAMGKAPADYDT